MAESKALFYLAVRIEEGVAECNGTTRVDSLPGSATDWIWEEERRVEDKVALTHWEILLILSSNYCMMETMLSV